MSKTRSVRDSMGEMEVPVDALYGAQTQRAINNFPISGQTLPQPFIRALVQIKAAAAQANAELGLIDHSKSRAIVAACDHLLGDSELMRHFPVDIFQTGSGTSTNMNANEVIATLASHDSGADISPNDDVNFGQSSNDVIPTCIHVAAALHLHNHLLPAMVHLRTSISEKADSVNEYVKTGRTHLMDAMPVRMSQVLQGWAAQIQADEDILHGLQGKLQSLAQGGTAVGTGVNCHPDFDTTFCNNLSARCGISFEPASNKFAAISSQDTAVALSGQLKTTAVSLMKIANDLRWMNSGPLAGLGEIELEALQPGSSIMPGKVNPVIPEAAAMVAAQVMGNDTTMTVAGASGNFELNVMLPLIAANLLNSLHLLGSSATLLADKAISSFQVRPDNIQAPLARNPILVTALNPIIGYAKAAEIAKLAYTQGRPIIDVATENCDLSRAELEALLDPEKLTQGGA